MTYVVTYIDVRPGSTSEAIGEIRQYREAANLGFEVLQEIRRLNRFVIFEAWKDESSFQTHETAGHTVEFRSRLRAIHKSPYDQRVHQGFAIAPERGAAGPGALVAVTHVDVPPPRREETEVLLKSLAEQGLKDQGNLRYDVFQQNAPRTNHFTLLSVWNDEQAFVSHEVTPHTLQFREALGPMLGAPYDERLYRRLI